MDLLNYPGQCCYDMQRLENQIKNIYNTTHYLQLWLEVGRWLGPADSFCHRTQNTWTHSCWRTNDPWYTRRLISNVVCTVICQTLSSKKLIAKQKQQEEIITRGFRISLVKKTVHVISDESKQGYSMLSSLRNAVPFPFHFLQCQYVFFSQGLLLL